MSIDFNNLNMLKDILGDELKDVLTIYMDNSPDNVLKLKDAIATNTLSTVQLEAHALKGSSANVGALKLSSICAELEQKAKNSDTESQAGLLSQIERENRAVIHALNDYIKTF